MQMPTTSNRSLPKLSSTKARRAIGEQRLTKWTTDDMFLIRGADADRCRKGDLETERDEAGRKDSVIKRFRYHTSPFDYLVARHWLIDGLVDRGKGLESANAIAYNATQLPYTG